MPDRLKVTSNQQENEPFSGKNSFSRHDRYREQEAKFERKWLENPHKYDPSQRLIERVRVDRIAKMIPFSELNGKRVADIGCGLGILAEKACRAGAVCDACDIASNALKQLPEHPKLHRKKTSLPETVLEDDAYDLVLCCDTIAELDPRDYRLAIAELCRILKPEGKAIVSTPLDIYADDSLDRFIKLVETEFAIIDSRLSYHSLYIRIINLLEKPQNYWKAYRNKGCRTKKLSSLSSLSKVWYALNSSAPFAWFWGVFRWIPLAIEKTVFERNSVLNFFEFLSKFFGDITAASHVIIVCKRKPLLLPGDINQPARPDRAPFIKEKQWE